MMRSQPIIYGSEFFSLVAFVSSLPRFFRYAVEVRQPDFYGGGKWEDALDDLLIEHNIDRVLAKWIDEGKKPFFFTHATDDYYAPRLARFFHGIMCQFIDKLAPMPEWPVEEEPRTAVHNWICFKMF
jgi:uncharacterized protein YecE (DUF72 family)